MPCIPRNRQRTGRSAGVAHRRGPSGRKEVRQGDFAFGEVRSGGWGPFPLRGKRSRQALSPAPQSSVAPRRPFGCRLGLVRQAQRPFRTAEDRAFRLPRNREAMQASSQAFRPSATQRKRWGCVGEVLILHSPRERWLASRSDAWSSRPVEGECEAFF